MCKYNKNCNLLRHILGLCDHYKQVDELQQRIVATRAMTNKELKSFNRTLNTIIKDPTIWVNLVRNGEPHD